MASASQPLGPLSEAALAFEQELAQYEKVCSELRRTKVMSHKTLGRTKRLLSEAAESEEALGDKLRGLLDAMNGARQKQEGCMQATLDAAEALQARAGEFAALLDRVARLGEQARELNAPVAQVIAARAVEANAGQLRSSLDEVSTRMASLVREADQIVSDADAGDWPEISKEVKSLKQQVQSALSKVVQTSTNVGGRLLS